MGKHLKICEWKVLDALLKFQVCFGDQEDELTNSACDVGERMKESVS
jgi:hypothetical protein